MFKVIEFIVGALFAGLLNSGINAAWVMCYLATSPEWLAKAREEVRATAAKYATNPNAPLRYQLDDVPLEAWESEFPVVDMCLRDSIRLNLLGTAFRKNITGRDIPTGNGDEVIPPNACVTYAIGDVHQDPNIYPDPSRWDPGRYLPERAEDKKVPYAFLGWGVARHPCRKYSNFFFFSYTTSTTKPVTNHDMQLACASPSSSKTSSLPTSSPRSTSTSRTRTEPPSPLRPRSMSTVTRRTSPTLRSFSRQRRGRSRVMDQVQVWKFFISFPSRKMHQQFLRFLKSPASPIDGFSARHPRTLADSWCKIFLS